MKAGRTILKRQSEEGIALLIAIFVLLLIGVVAIALIVSSGTESALAGNYRYSTTVYYAAVAGLEEARARLRSNNPNSFNNTTPPGTFLPPAGTPLGVCNPVYVINPLGGEAVTPWDQANTYFDREFSQELAAVCGGAVAPPSPSPTTLSVWNRNPLNGLPFPGPLYKWVRINAVSEKSLNLDVDADGLADSTTPLYYDNTNSRFSNNPGVGPQALELTALAVLPNGSQKLLQYLTAGVPVNLPPFLAALTMVTKSGNNLTYTAPTSNGGYKIRGVDQDTVVACAPGLPVRAGGVFSSADRSNVINGIPAVMQSKYDGISSPGPDVQDISGIFPANLQTPAGIEAFMQTIIQSADVVIPGPATGSSLPSAMYSPSPNPMTIVVNGDLDLTGWHNTGSGLLLVRGNLNYDPDASWNGIVMVVGQGTVTGSKGGNGEIDGAFFMATTLDAAGNILSPNLGKPSMVFGPNMGGEGIRYSSCWIQSSQPVGSIKILSFHEISQ